MERVDQATKELRILNQRLKTFTVKVHIQGIESTELDTEIAELSTNIAQVGAMLALQKAMLAEQASKIDQGPSVS